MAAHLCIVKGCGAIVADRAQPRCPAHGRRRDATPRGDQYDRRHRELAARAIARHVARHGWVCPGWRRPPHPVPVGGLTGDHVQSIKDRPDLAWDPSNYGALCPGCNSRKGSRSGSWTDDPVPRRRGSNRRRRGGRSA